MAYTFELPSAAVDLLRCVERLRAIRVDRIQKRAKKKVTFARTEWQDEFFELRGILLQ